MRVLVQRVSEARVTTAGETVGDIGPGFLLLVGMTSDDTPVIVRSIATKVANLRVFPDAAGDMNCSALDRIASGEPAGMLVVSQFTLYADTRKGRRPSFARAAAPTQAAPLVEQFASDLRTLGLPVATGRFGAMMQVSLVNDGPVTIWLES